MRVRVLEVEGVEMRGGRPVEFRLAWPDDRPFLRVISSHEPVPPAYRPAEGATGRIGRCGAPRQYGTLAVLFPPTGPEPTVVDGVRFVYEVDGDRYETVADVFLARCPEGTESGGGERRPCRPDERQGR